MKKPAAVESTVAGFLYNTFWLKHSYRMGIMNSIRQSENRAVIFTPVLAALRTAFHHKAPPSPSAATDTTCAMIHSVTIFIKLTTQFGKSRVHQLPEYEIFLQLIRHCKDFPFDIY